MPPSADGAPRSRGRRADRPNGAADGRAEARAVVALLSASAVLLIVRIVAATRVGFGDSEALYACYALHPQPAYLDHPGLIGVFAQALGGGTSPTPLRAHLATGVLATLVPWVVALACRACGAPWGRAAAAALVVALVPEMAIGLFAMTPDLLLALAWTGTLALAATALRSPAGSTRGFVAFVGAGLLSGVACASKVTGVTLFVALALAYLRTPARAHARTVAPWAGLVAGALVFAPVVQFEVASGWPMLRHRLVDTQAAAGVSLRNLGALVGGQLAYLSPLVVVLVALAMRSLWRERRDVVGSLLLATCLVPLAVLVPLCVWSRVAEPHWIAPALLALAPAAARTQAPPSRRLVVASVGLAAVVVLAVHAWVLVPPLLRLAPASYDPRLDLANELRGWPEVVAAARQEARSESTPTSSPGEVVIVGPHWVVCAQLEAALRGEVPVGCTTPVRDDFDDWLPRSRWQQADSIVWVTDRRFGAPPDLPAYAPLRTREVRIERAGRTVRVFTLVVLARRAQA
jgi:hypothetical protein